VRADGPPDAVQEIHIGSVPPFDRLRATSREK
jgi:hypothetical protein